MPLLKAFGATCLVFLAIALWIFLIVISLPYFWLQGAIIMSPYFGATMFGFYSYFSITEKEKN